MEAPSGYSREELLFSNSRASVYAARRASDGADVLLKVYRDATPATARQRAERERALLSRLAGPGIATPIADCSSESLAMLALDGRADLTLLGFVEHTSPGVAHCLDVACALVEALCCMHRARFLHRDLTPAKILVDSGTCDVWMIDLESAHPVGQALTSAAARTAPRGGRASSARRRADRLAYIAPEATGRMGRGTDERSDLYSLGAVLYFLFTGRPPFGGDDALGLIHAHLAKPVTPAHELRPDLDPTISRLVHKLLEKAPEDRYQTAHALRHDLLDCREQLRRTGAIRKDLELGVVDVPHRPLFSKKLCGRETEIEQLHRAHARSIAGTPGLVLLSGPPGMGKSELVQQLRVAIVESGGYFALGKFDAYRRDTPHAGFVRAFTSLVQQILTESDARLAMWRRELLASLGQGAAALATLIPDLRIVLGELDAAPVLTPDQSRFRLALAVVRFLEAAATRAHPLVLCLDDLQWADPGSLELFRNLLLRNKCEALLVVGVYRDTEVDPDHALGLLCADLRAQDVPIDHIELRPLSQDASAEMLAAALGRSASETRELARHVARKSGNLPFLIQQIVHRAYDLGLIHFEPGTGWVWDDAELAAMDIPDDAVSLMTAKLAGLPRAAVAVLELASCASESFDLDTLAGSTHRPREEIESALFLLCDEGLIAPACSGFRFAHERIRESARALLSRERREGLHREAALLLLEREGDHVEGTKGFEIADHLVLAGAEIGGDERRRALEVLLGAGKEALQSGAVEVGARYLRAAHGHFDETLWETAPALGFDLFLQSAEAARQERDYESSLRLLETLECHAVDRIAQAQVAAKQIAVYTTSLPPETCLPEILRVLRRFGIRWSPRPSRFRLRLDGFLTERALRGRLDAVGFSPRKRSEGVEWIAQLMVLAAAAGAVTLYSAYLAHRMLGFMLRAYRRNGAGPGMQVLLASWGAHRLSTRFDLSGAERYARAACEWAEVQKDPVRTARMDYSLYNVIYPVLGCRRQTLDPLRAAAERSIELGDHEFGVYAFWAWIVQMLMLGEHLSLVRVEEESLARRTRGASATRTSGLLTAIVGMLDGSAFRIGSEREMEAALSALLERLRGHSASRFGPWAAWAMLLAVVGRFEDLLETTARSQSGGVTAQVGVFRVDLMFYRGLAIGACAPTATLLRRRRLRRELFGYARSLDRWARINPGLAPMARALEAECARLRKRAAEALSLYGGAASDAQQQGYLQHAALLYERRATLLQAMRRRPEAIADLAKAKALYEAWGAHAKAASLAGELRR